MNTNTPAVIFAFALVLAAPAALCADDPPPAASDKSLTERAKEVGKEVGATVSRDAKAVGEAAKEGAIKVAHAAKKGAQKVKAAVKPDKSAATDAPATPSAPAAAPPH